MLIAFVAGMLILAGVIVFNDTVRQEVEQVVFREPVITDSTAPVRNKVTDIRHKVDDAMGVPEDTATQNAPAEDSPETGPKTSE